MVVALQLPATGSVPTDVRASSAGALTLGAARYPLPGSPPVIRARTAVVAGAGVVLTGAAGTGKTALARAVTADLEPERFASFWIVGTQAAASIPFGALAGLLPAADDLTLALEPAQVLSAVVDELDRRSAGRWPVLIVDDAHLLDGPSASVLLGLALGGRVRLLITLRVPTGESDPAVSDALVALWKDDYLRRLELGPLEHADVLEVISGELGGPMAASGVELLKQWTQSNPLYLTELLRHGRAEGLIRYEDGFWWWDAPLVMPPALEDLFDRRIDRVSSAARDVLAALALSGPLPIDLLLQVFPAEAVLALEDAGLVQTRDVEEHCQVRLTHPLLVAAVGRHVTPARQRLVARALLATDQAPDSVVPGLVTRALWQLTAGGPVDPELLRQAAVLTLHSDPRLSQRLARRALVASGRPQAAIALADALIEGGDPEAALAVLTTARIELEARFAAADPQARPQLAADRREAAIALAGHRTWVGRDPDGALDDLGQLEPDPEVDSIAALILLFSGRTEEALARADQVLDTADSGSARARAGLARTAALTLVGRTRDAVRTGEQLLAELERHGTTLPYSQGMARAALALAQLWRAPSDESPVSDPRSGRWPAEPEPGAGAGVQPTGWALFDGYELRIRGDRPGAIRRLREALVQQSGGESLFRSEAAAWLVITLAENGEVEEAAEVLDRLPPDRIGLVPGLEPWARGALAQAVGDPETALAQLRRATEVARAAGSKLVELGYLLSTMELTGRVTDGDADRLAELAADVDAPRLVAVAAGVLALAGRRDDPLEVADQLEASGVYRTALAVAELAQTSAQGVRARAEVDGRVARLRVRLGLADPQARPSGLTAREWELAELAARGLTDRQIAERLVLSVRTVQTHLARAYRKLQVGSRRELATALTAAMTAAEA
jgi:DNA-binding NarL/FixJ family response regulator